MIRFGSRLLALSAAAAALVGAAALVACKKKEAAAVPSTVIAKHACDRRVASTSCIEYPGALGTEAYVKKECAGIASAKYLAGPCPAGAIGRCAKYVGGPDEQHVLVYQGNFETVKQTCLTGGGVWQPAP